MVYRYPPVYNEQMNIDFFDNPDETPRMREDVRFESLRIEVSPEGRRVAVDLVIVPFIERPTVELTLTNGEQKRAGLLTIIETLDRKIQVVMHLRDAHTVNPYTLDASLFYASVDEEMNRQKVDNLSLSFEARPGLIETASINSSPTK